MNLFLADKIKLGTFSVVITATLFLFAKWWWSKAKKPRPPSNWIKVGEISDICVFPVKSMGCIRESAVECTMLGCKKGWLRDRTLMVTDVNGRFVTARKFPKMILVRPSIDGSVLTLEAPGMLAIKVDLAHVGNKIKTSIWGQTVPACDCGDEVALWLSRVLLQEDIGLRLVYYPLDRPYRDVKQGFPLIESTDTVSH